MNSLIIIFIFYFLIPLSCIGYGLATVKYIHKIKTDNLGLLGLIGVFILIIYSYFSHFFIKHGEIHNSILLSLGFLFFIKLKNDYISKNNLIIFLIVFIILFLGFLIHKSHDDFVYYHFPYTYYLTQYPQFFGIGIFNHGFRTPSSIFYLNSLFYLPFLKYYMFQIGAVLIMGFANLYIILSLKNFNLNGKYDQRFYFYILIFLFINIFFYRISEHGTDRSAQILIFLLFVELLFFNYAVKNFNNNVFKIFIFLGIIISLKSFYLLYLILLIPIIYKASKINFYLYFKKIFNLPITYLFLILIVLNTFVSLSNTGCLVYPLKGTCIETVEWTIPKEEVSSLNTHYQWWAKAGGGPGYEFALEKSEYIKNFNWLRNWFDKYFFNKVSDFLLGIIFLLLIIFLIYKSKNRNIKKKNFDIFLYSFSLILFIEWFLNHPALRYGGYVIISLIIFYPFVFYISSFNGDNIKGKTIILIILGLIIFSGRNIDRIIKEKNIYKFEPIKNPVFDLKEDNFRFDRVFKELINNYNFCINKNNKCTDKYDQNIKKVFSNYIFIKK